MHDIRFIRKHPEKFTEAMQRRSVTVTADEILQIDRQRRGLQSEIQDMQSRRNAASKDIGTRKAKGQDDNGLIAEVNSIKAKLSRLEDEETALARRLEGYLLELPNILDVTVPDGSDETDNAVVRTVGDIPKFDFVAKDHVVKGEGLGQMDFALGAKLSGARVVVLSGQLAQLERALASFMLDTHTQEFGYVETLPPALVNSKTVTCLLYTSPSPRDISGTRMPSSA